MKILGPIVFVLVCSGAMYLLFVDYQRSNVILELSYDMIANGQIQEGLAKCEESSFAVANCYVASFYQMTAEGIEVPEGYCENFKTKPGPPWWYTGKEAYSLKIEEHVAACEDFIASGGAGEPTVFIDI